MLAQLLAAFLCLVAGQNPNEGQTEARVLWRDVRAPESEAVELVFLPDGFTEEERPAFEASVREAIRLLEVQTASFVRTKRDSWNLHVGFVPSATACPGRPGESAGDTAFRTHLSTPEGGGLFESDDAAIAAAAHALAPGVDCAIVVVRAREPLPFATGDLPLEGARIRIPEGFESALLHELGHSLYSLGDEYVGHEGTLPAAEQAVVPFYPNLTLDPHGGRFAFLCGTRVPVEEGALDFRRGVYRAVDACVMRDPAADHFCSPCAAVIAAGLPAAPPAAPPRLEVVPGASWTAVLEPEPERGILRRLAVLFPLEEPREDNALREAFAAAAARVSRKTRYMESAWLGDGSRPGERVFSLEPHTQRVSLGALAPGAYALVAARADLLAYSPATIVRFQVPAPPSAPEAPR